MKKNVCKLFLLLLLSSNSIYVLVAQKINLPLEILGNEGAMVTTIFTIDDEQFSKISNTNNLWVQANNLSYQNKGSIRVNDGNWISLNHNNVSILSPEKEYGGMAHGGYNTIRYKLTIPLTGTGSFNSNSSPTTRNVIQFRFDTSDGISNGFRVIDMDLLDTNGNRILKNADYYINPNTQTQQFGISYYNNDNPNDWTTPFYVNGVGEPSDIATKIASGKKLWYYGRNGDENTAGEDLWNHYDLKNTNGFWYNQNLGGARPIKAKCSSCHTQDGRDLEIFAYSNKSIIERSKFHRLTEEEGKEIAAYIRSLSEDPTSGNIGRYGRPWNPPYQPGPELANKPVQEWAAGAGLDAVLEKDEEMLPYLFPNGTSQENVDAFFDADVNFDTYTLPLAIQFPDWKHWLPIIHPMDAYSKGTFYKDTYTDRTTPYSFNQEYTLHNPEKGYEILRNALETAKKKADGITVDLGGMAATELENLFELHKQFRFSFRWFQGQQTTRGADHWRSKTGLGLDALADGVSVDLAATSLARLMAVKNFELMNEFNLQDQGPEYLNPVDNPSDRQWSLGDAEHHVYEVPAHFTGCIDGDCQSFTGQLRATGQFESTAWYQLQMILTPGHGVNNFNTPVDFNYQPEFILKASFSSGINQPLRYYHTLNNMYQAKTWSKGTNPNDGKGFRIRVMGPWYFLGKEADAGRNQLHGFASGVWPAMLNTIEDDLTIKVLNAQFKQFLKEVEDASTENTDDDLYNEGKNRIYNKDGSDAWFRYGSVYNGRTQTNGSQNLDEAGKSVILDVTENVNEATPMYADHMYWTIIEAEKLGVDCNLLKRAVKWSKAAFPNINTLISKGSSINIDWDSMLSCTSLSTNDVAHRKEVSIYPNPTSNSISVNGLAQGNYQIVVYNMLGQEVLKSSLSTVNSTINTSQLKRGSYVLVIQNQSSKKIFKLIKN